MALNLGPKLGPFPVGGWAALVAGAAGLGLLLRRRDGGAVAVQVPNALTAVPADSIGADLSIGGGGTTSYDGGSMALLDWLQTSEADRAAERAAAEAERAAERGEWLGLIGSLLGGTPAQAVTTPPVTPTPVPSREQTASPAVQPVPVVTPQAPSTPVAQTPIPVRVPGSDTYAGLSGAGAPSVAAATTAVGGGVPAAQRTNVGGTRTLSSFPSWAQQDMRSGAPVVAGDGRVFVLVNGVPTSIGMRDQVV